MDEMAKVRKKVLFINGHLNVGGCERSLVDVLNHMNYEKYDVDLLLLEELGTYYSEIPHNVNVHFCDLHNTYGSLLVSLTRCIKMSDWKCFWIRLLIFLKKILGGKALKHVAYIILGKHSYDCVIAYRPGFPSELAAYSVKATKRITWWHHGEWLGDSRSYADMGFYMDQIVTVSKGCKEMLSNLFPQLIDKMICIPNLLDSNELATKSNINPYQDQYLHIVSVGRLSAEKHFDNIIPAIKIILKKGHDVRWHIIGDGPEKNNLQMLIDINCLQNNLILEGNKDNPYPYIAYANLFVHPSYVESQGLSILEAMSLGVPVIVTKSSGPSEYIIDGENGILTEQNAESLASCVLQLIEDPSQYCKIKQRTKCPEIFSAESVMYQIEKILED